jgi:hypothetical protein
MGDNEALKPDPFAGRMPEKIGDFHLPSGEKIWSDFAD